MKSRVDEKVRTKDKMYVHRPCATHIRPKITQYRIQMLRNPFARFVEKIWENFFSQSDIHLQTAAAHSKLARYVSFDRTIPPKST